MKLLGWMHRKFRQNSSEAIKEYTTGQQLLDDQQNYTKTYGTVPLWRGNKEYSLRKSTTGFEAARAEENDFEEESSSVASDLFHGFLTIGTFGLDPNITNPPTPAFATSVENIAENETEVTEKDLRLVTEELEKVLGAEAKEESCTDSSGRNSHVSAGRNSHVSTGRNSHVSTGRSSHGSTITLGGRPLEDSETNGNRNSVFPLQGYLLGSAVELPETAVGKKEHRTSLGELFQRTKLDEESSFAKCERGEKRAEKESEKSAKHLFKKMLEKKILNASRSSGGPIDSTSADTKLQKILQMFHRKVHPECSKTAAKTNNTYKEMKIASHDGGHVDGEQGLLSGESTKHYKSQYNLHQLKPNGSDPYGNREYWIKSDANYLVLEL